MKPNVNIKENSMIEENSVEKPDNVTIYDDMDLEMFSQYALFMFNSLDSKEKTEVAQVLYELMKNNEGKVIILVHESYQIRIHFDNPKTILLTFYKGETVTFSNLYYKNFSLLSSKIDNLQLYKNLQSYFKFVDYADEIDLVYGDNESLIPENDVVLGDVTISINDINKVRHILSNLLIFDTIIEDIVLIDGEEFVFKYKSYHCNLSYKNGTIFFEMHTEDGSISIIVSEFASKEDPILNNFIKSLMKDIYKNLITHNLL